MMIWVLTLRPQFLLMAVMDWSCTGIRVPSMIHVPPWIGWWRTGGQPACGQIRP